MKYVNRLYLLMVYAVYALNIFDKEMNKLSEFDKEIIKELLEIQWWNWETSKIDRFVPLLQSDDIRGFIRACKEDAHSCSTKD